MESNADVALVVCGTRAGFFVREADGTIDSLCTPEEFVVPVPSRKQAARSRSTASGKSPQKKFPWSLAGAAALFLFALVLGGAVYVRSLLPQPLALTLSEQDGQMLIGWNLRAGLEGGKLEIAQQMANHESTCTTGLYDRREDLLTLDEVERILI